MDADKTLGARGVPIERGPIERMLGLQGELEAHGIPADVLESNPCVFWNGTGTPYHHELIVPARSVAAARSVVKDWQPIALEVEEPHVRRSSNRPYWWSVSGMTLPPLFLP